MIRQERLDCVSRGLRKPRKSWVTLDSWGSNWMGKVTAQLEETTYFFSGGDEEVRFVADDNDEVRTTVSTDQCGRSKWVLKHLHLNSEFIVRLDRQNSYHKTVGRGEGPVLSSH
jgi:hypothetical protein